MRGDINDEKQHEMSSHLDRCAGCLATLNRIELSRSVDVPCAHGTSPYLAEENFFRLLEWAENLNSIGVTEKTPVTVEAELPKQFGRFEVEGILGVGAFGRVYKAYDTLLKRSVAIKAPHRSKFGTESDLANFLNEARHAASLDREGIVPIYDVLVEACGKTLIVMKYIKGKSLAEVRRTEKIGVLRAVQLMIDISEAVNYAHERGFVHRDLKPANILIDEDGSPWVTDFGLGLSLNATNGPFDLHGGTPSYMSPEQVRRDIPSIDRRSDVWSMGVMLAELVILRLPFPQTDRKDLFNAILYESPQLGPPRKSSLIESTIKRCLAKSREDRFANAKQLADQLNVWRKRYLETLDSKPLSKWRKAFLACLIAIVSYLAMRAWFYYFKPPEQFYFEMDDYGFPNHPFWALLDLIF